MFELRKIKDEISVILKAKKSARGHKDVRLLKKMALMNYSLNSHFDVSMKESNFKVLLESCDNTFGSE